MGKLCLSLLLCLAAAAQTASISGVVRNADGTPLGNAFLSDGHTTVEANADGTFTFSGLGPGAVTLSVTGTSDGAAVQFSRGFTLLPGQYLTGVDLVVTTFASLSGHVTDSAGNPLRGILVQLSQREFRGGVQQYVPARGGQVTDEHGAYRFPQIPPGMSYVLAAVPREGSAVSAAADSRRRNLVLPVTYFPGVTDIDGAQSIVLRPGEALTGIDLKLTATAGYCIGGVIQVGGSPGPAPYDVFREDGAGLIVRAVSGGGSADHTGKFLQCGLVPGSYRVVAGLTAPAQGTYQGAAAQITLRDGDDRDVRLAVQMIPPVKFSWEWAGTAPSPAIPLPVAASLTPVNPGQSQAFQISGSRGSMPLNDYIVEGAGLPLGYYIKDETLGGIHSLRRHLLPWTSVLTGAEIHYVIGRDGGTIGGTVTDTNGNPIPDSRVLIMAEDAATPAELSIAMLVVAPDGNGQFISSTVAPAKYQVLATTSTVVLTPEGMARILRARPGAQEVEVGPSGTTSVKLNPVRLE